MQSLADEVSKLQNKLTKEEFDFFLRFVKKPNIEDVQKVQNITVCDKPTFSQYAQKDHIPTFTPLFKIDKPTFSPYVKEDRTPTLSKAKITKPIKTRILSLNHKKLVFSNNYENYKTVNQKEEEAFFELYSNKEKFSKGKGKGTCYRGVSKNGNRYQVILFINGKKRYIGSFPTLEKAARVYDKYAITYQRKKARTNFIYSKAEYDAILEGSFLYKYKDITN